jgi:hypothetical protein
MESYNAPTLFRNLQNGIWVEDRSGLLGGEFSDYNSECPTVDNVFVEWHAPCTLNIPFCRFLKRVGAL